MSPRPAKSVIPSLHSLHAKVLLAIDHAVRHGDNEVSYAELANELGRHANTITRVVNDLEAAGWLTKTRHRHHHSFVIHRSEPTEDGTELGDWIDANR